MVEEEATQKACPWMSQGSFSGGTGIVKCLGSNCMAWQRYESAAFKNNAEYVFRRDGKTLISTEGYCSRGAKPKDAP